MSGFMVSGVRCVVCNYGVLCCVMWCGAAGGQAGGEKEEKGGPLKDQNLHHGAKINKTGRDADREGNQEGQDGVGGGDAGAGFEVFEYSMS